MRADSTASSLVDAPKMLTFFLAMLSSIPAVCLMIHTPALPAMAVHYGTTEQTVRSIQTGFALAVAIVQISFVFFYAPLAERFGRKRLTIASLAVFSIGSLGCTLADDIGQGKRIFPPYKIPMSSNYLRKLASLRAPPAALRSVREPPRQNQPARTPRRRG